MNAASGAVAVAAISVAWGALSFGAVYPWGYWPLAAACLISGCAGLVATPVRPRIPPTRSLVSALCLVALVVVVQLIPLPRGWLETISPGTITLLKGLDSFFAYAPAKAHSISIDPARTLRALVLYGSLALFLCGLTRALSVTGVSRLAGALSIVGVVVALTGIVYKPPVGGRIYGFWATFDPGDSFGPFVNKNHFAGWMLLALPITLGSIGAALGSEGSPKRDWRSRLLWVATPQASRIILFATGALVMALSLVMTMSRSGITAFAVAIVMSAAFVVSGAATVPRKTMGTLYLLILAVAVTSWVGVDALVQRFSTTQIHDFNIRKGAWLDALNVIRLTPAIGAGLNTYGQASLLYQRHDLEHSYSAVHNDYLQIVTDGGAVLAVAAGACMFMLARDVRRRRRNELDTSASWMRAGAITSLIAIALQEGVEFSLQIPGNAVLFAVVCAIALHDPPPHARRTRGGASFVSSRTIS